MPLTYAPPSRASLAWVAAAVHPRGRVSAAVRLVGGLTAHMDRVTVETPSGAYDVVLRRWPEDRPGSDSADGLVARESAALTALRGRRIPVPELLASDEDGSRCGVRCTLTTFLDGEPDLAPTDLRSWLGQLAATQAAIHAVPARDLTRWDGFFEDRDRELEWLDDAGLRAAARDAASGPLNPEQVFVHGDYQHFNVLWRQGRLSGVVDWTHAGIGSRGADVGHCRLNLAVLFGAGPAADYLAAYESEAGVPVDRRADLRALLSYGASWQGFIPRQVAGRANLDVAGMPDRVTHVVREAVAGIG